MTFDDILEKYRSAQYSKRDEGTRFEELMKAWLLTEPTYITTIEKVWMWSEFPYKKDFGSGKDVGIDLVALTYSGDYWAVQCKCYAPGTTISKRDVDTFLSTSGKVFRAECGVPSTFSTRMWIDTSDRWTSEAENLIRDQIIPVIRVTYDTLYASRVDWEKLDGGIYGPDAVSSVRKLLPHQDEAVEAFHEHFKTETRGRLIMACGTGKTFTSLCIAQNEVPQNGLALFLVPSIALLNQTLIEWMTYSMRPIHPICICSDPSASKRKKEGSETDTVNLALPATTDPGRIAKYIEESRKVQDKGMIVVFSTYQSIDEVSNAQREINARKPNSCVFDLVICDEAHRTTGMAYKQTVVKRDKNGSVVEQYTKTNESSFIRVHDNKFIEAKKRLYMTATPRLYKDEVKKKVKGEYKDKIEYLCSMDDEGLYGKEVYRIGFGKAVSLGLLSDYKVLVLTIEAGSVPKELRKPAQAALERELAGIKDEKQRGKTRDKELASITTYVAKLIGSTNALSKRLVLNADLVKGADPAPMRTAVAFCQNIRTSRLTAEVFNACAKPYVDLLPEAVRETVVDVHASHVDGTMGAIERQGKLKWLKGVPASSDDRECRILTNVRCLSEGVDVPALDAVIFLSERNSQVDVVQSVGRVMRKAPGKKYGYIVIPVVIPEGKSPEEELEKGDSFAVVWTVLNALRAHDDRFDAEVNKLDLTRSGKIIVDPPHEPPSGQIIGDPIGPGPTPPPQPPVIDDEWYDVLQKRYGEFINTVYARMVEKVGTRAYWEIWAKDIAEVAKKHQERIKRLISEREDYREAFNAFLKDLREDINPGVTEDGVIEMLAQHIITRPIFESLFKNYSFVGNNPVSRSMERLLALIKEDFPEDERKKTDEIYKSICDRCSGIDNTAGRQRVIVELYNKFFMTAFPKTVSMLGIVYTPVEIVDFILRSADEVLHREFGRRLTDENVHILDPFTGTGTFITRLLQLGLIKKEDLKRKYESEIHANEIVLLAYYIASINIENVYHDVSGDASYSAFNGICLTDTFNQFEQAKMFEKEENSKRIKHQKEASIQVIVGNPPYSAGQNSANDDAQNEHYERLEGRIAETYAKYSSSTNRNSLYDSYIKAFRWASDRISEKGGVIAFVSNGAWIDDNSKSGFRHCLEREFSRVYVYNLRGNQRTSGDLSRREGGKIFGSGSRTPIAITILVKRPGHTGKAEVFYRDIGDYLSRDKKLEIIKEAGSALSGKITWTRLEPNEYDDWINKRSTLFAGYPVLGDKKDKSQETYFVPHYSCGIKSNRDPWVYNFSSSSLEKNMRSMISFYNECVRTRAASGGKEITHTSDGYDINDPTKIAWGTDLKDDCKSGKIYDYDANALCTAVYRPFVKESYYFDRRFNERLYQIPQLFPTPQHSNLLICVSGNAANTFSTLMVNCIPDLNMLAAGAQCFPLYYYEKAQAKEQDVQGTLFGSNSENEPDEYGYIRHSGVSEYIVDLAHRKYKRPDISRERIFYYVYGFLHTPEYRKRFSADLKKSLPRLPLVENYETFEKISRIGAALASLHTNYESVPPAKVTVTGEESGYYRVEQMKFARGSSGKPDKTRIIYNNHITISDIPLRAYDYVVNGKSAIEWLMERYAVTTDKKSQLLNEPNDWCAEHGNPRYILDLLLSVISVSLKTLDLIDELPKIEFQKE